MERKKIVCELCDIDRQEYICQNCDVFICHRCKKMHSKQPVTAHHQVVSSSSLQISEISQRILEDKCLKHSCVQNQFCHSCLESLCSDCMDQHPQCSLSDYENACTVENDLAEKLHVEVDDILDELKLFLKLQHSKLLECAEKKNNLIKEIKETSQRKSSQIVKEEGILIKALERQYKIEIENAENTYINASDCHYSFQKCQATILLPIQKLSDRTIWNKVLQERIKQTRSFKVFGDVKLEFSPDTSVPRLGEALVGSQLINTDSTLVPSVIDVDLNFNSDNLKNLKSQKDLCLKINGDKDKGLVKRKATTSTSPSLDDKSASTDLPTMAPSNSKPYVSHNDLSLKTSHSVLTKKSITKFDDVKIEGKGLERKKKSFVLCQNEIAKNFPNVPVSYMLCGRLVTGEYNRQAVRSQTLCKPAVNNAKTDLRLLLLNAISSNNGGKLWIKGKVKVGLFVNGHDNLSVNDAEFLSALHRLSPSATCYVLSEEQAFQYFCGPLALVNLSFAANEAAAASSKMTECFDLALKSILEAAPRSPLSKIINLQGSRPVTNSRQPQVETVPTVAKTNSLACKDLCSDAEMIANAQLKVGNIVELKENTALSVFRVGPVTNKRMQLNWLVKCLHSLSKKWHGCSSVLYYHCSGMKWQDIDIELARKLFYNVFCHQMKCWQMMQAKFPSCNFMTVCLVSSNRKFHHHDSQGNFDVTDMSMQDWKAFATLSDLS